MHTAIKKVLLVDKKALPDNAEVTLLRRVHSVSRIYELALTGRIYALAALADMYYYGKEISENKELAIHIFQDLTEDKAMPLDFSYSLATMLEGMGDYKKAFTLYSSLQHRGHGLASVRLACMYRYGWGVVRNIEKSRDNYKRGAKSGSVRARSAYAHFLLHEGSLTEKIYAIGIFARNIIPAIMVGIKKIMMVKYEPLKRWRGNIAGIGPSVCAVYAARDVGPSGELHAGPRG